MEKARILIVEDEAIIAMEVESQLKNLGYEVTSIVDTGEKAIAKAEEDIPDLMLMDIRIKGEMDGIETAEIIKNRFGIPVIFSTAYLDQERIGRAKITMPFGYVLKPIQERELKVTLEMALYVAKVDLERKKAEHLFSQLFLQSKTSTQLFDTKGNCIMVNQVFCDLFGVDAEVITDGRYNVFEDQAAIDSGVIPLVKEVFIEKKTNKWTINFDISIASGSTDTPSTRKEKVWIDVLAYPILDANDNMEFVILQHYDITSRKHGEEELIKYRENLEELVSEKTAEIAKANSQLQDRISEVEKVKSILHESEEKYRMLFENVPISYQSLNANGEFIDVNQIWLDEFGYKKDEVVGKKFVDFMTDPYKALLPERFAGFKQSGQIRNLEFEIICKNGKTKNGAFTGNISRDEKGTFKRTHCVFTPKTNDILEK